MSSSSSPSRDPATTSPSSSPRSSSVDASTTPRATPMCGQGSLAFPLPIPIPYAGGSIGSSALGFTIPATTPSRLSASRPILPTTSTSSPPSPPSPPVAGPSTASPVPEKQDGPALLSTLGASDGESVLCVCVDDGEDGGLGTNGQAREARVYAGSQGGAIHVWDLRTHSLRARLTGHTGAVLALQLVPERDWLISASGDGTIRVWHSPTLTPLYLIHPPHDNVGDIFSLAWISTEKLDGDTSRTPVSNRHVKGKGRLYAGCQDTSIQWIDLPPSFHLPLPSQLSSSHSNSSPLSHPSIPAHLSSLPNSASSSPPIHRAPSKFFDSLSSTDLSRSSLSKSATSLVGLGREAEDEERVARKRKEHVVELQIQLNDIAVSAHYGYVYCLSIGKSNDQVVLISGAGDDQLKLWRMDQHELTQLHTLESASDAVLTMAVHDNTIYAGHQGGVIKIWDLDTLTCVRTLRPHALDILSLSLQGPTLYAGSASGQIQAWDKSFNLVQTWDAHEGIVLASSIASGGSRLVTGGNDAVMKVWDIEQDRTADDGVKVVKGFEGEMFHTLAKLVAFHSIADDQHREECRQNALYLRRVLRDLGAEASLLPGAPGRNPLVLATFRANASPASPDKKRKRVLCYGHYDVVPAPASDLWTADDPFELMGLNGWLYGRGVSDNKGPMLAIAAAASELREKQELDVDLVMVIEGEEETGSAGFQDAIRSNRDKIGPIDVILVSNSYWIGEDTPCLTFGLRGVIHATLKITSDQPDLHSGMQGGVVSEPLVDMVRLLASLTDADGRVRIPGFLDDVRRLGAEENALFDDVVQRCRSEKNPDKLSKHSHEADPKRSLINRWRQPALSIHDIQTSGESHKSLIPNWAASSVSIRIVPDQSLLAIIEQLKGHLNKAFSQLRTVNQLSIDINHVADWWLGDLNSPYFKAFTSIIESEWGGVKPLFIREGGSIPSLPFLEREFAADAVHFPMGTSSDSAHLPDERIKIVNLEKGKTIVSKWLVALGNMEEGDGHGTPTGHGAEGIA